MSLGEKALQAAFGEPTEKQEEFHKATTRHVGYGGAKGGGKSHAVRYKSTMLGYEYPGIQMMIVRRTFPELFENHTKRLLSAYSHLPVGIRPKYVDAEKSFIFPEPFSSRIKLGYCATETDVLQYQGQEYDVLFIDEATQFTEYQYSWLDATVRGANNYPKRTYYTCNPGGVGHKWVKNTLIDKVYKSGQLASDYTFIHAKAWDNLPMFESDPGYVRAIKALKKKHGKITPAIQREAMEQSDVIRRLKSMPRDLREAWLEGNWDIFAGQYFREWDENIHIVKPFDIPQHWRKSLAMDYGLDCFAVLWFAISEYGQVYCYRSLERTNLTISMAVEAIKEIHLKHPQEKIQEYVAPPDLWSRRSDTGKSAYTVFAENGIPLTKAGNSREQGWLNVKEYLRVKDGAPRMVFFDTCDTVFNSLPELQHDTHKVNDAATEPHEHTHTPDALRYWCSRRQLIPEIEIPTQPDPFGLNKPIEEGVCDDYLVGGFDVY